MEIPIIVDGVEKTVMVPDDATDAEIDEIVNLESGGVQPPASPAAPMGPFARINRKWEQRAERTKQGMEVPETTGLEKAGQVFGGIAGAVGDVPAAIVEEAASELLPPKAKEAIRGGLGKVAQTLEPGIARVGKKVETFKTEHPRATANIEAAGGVANLAANVAAPPIAKATETAVGKGLKNAAGGILQRSVVPRPSSVIENAMDAKDLLKYGVAGSNKESLKKINALFDKTGKDVDRVIEQAQAAKPDARINLYDVLGEIKQKMENKEIKETFGQYDKVVKEINALEDELKTFNLTGDLTIAQANEAKKLIGQKSFMKGIPSPETAPKELAYDLAYLNLMKRLENEVPEIRDLNQVFHKLIPWKEEIKWRLGPNTNKSPFGILGLLSGLSGSGIVGAATQDPFLATAGFAGGIAANQATKSPTVAKGLYGLGKAMTEPIGIKRSATSTRKP